MSRCWIRFEVFIFRRCGCGIMKKGWGCVDGGSLPAALSRIAGDWGFWCGWQGSFYGVFIGWVVMSFLCCEAIGVGNELHGDVIEWNKLTEMCSLYRFVDRCLIILMNYCFMRKIHCIIWNLESLLIFRGEFVRWIRYKMQVIMALDVNSLARWWKIWTEKLANVHRQVDYKKLSFVFRLKKFLLILPTNKSTFTNCRPGENCSTIKLQYIKRSRDPRNFVWLYNKDNFRAYCSANEANIPSTIAKTNARTLNTQTWAQWSRSTGINAAHPRSLTYTQLYIIQFDRAFPGR